MSVTAAALGAIAACGGFIVLAPLVAHYGGRRQLRAAMTPGAVAAHAVVAGVIAAFPWHERVRWLFLRIPKFEPPHFHAERLWSREGSAALLVVDGDEIAVTAGVFLLVGDSRQHHFTKEPAWHVSLACPDVFEQVRDQLRRIAAPDRQEKDW